MVKVINGVNEISAPLEGRTIREVGQMLAQPLNIDPSAQPTVNGTVVGCDHQLADGDELEFVKPAGTKG